MALSSAVFYLRLLEFDQPLALSHHELAFDVDDLELRVFSSTRRAASKATDHNSDNTHPCFALLRCQPAASAAFALDAVAGALQLRGSSLTRRATGEATHHTSDKTPLASLSAHRERAIVLDPSAGALQLRGSSLTRRVTGEATGHTSDKTHPLLRFHPTANPHSPSIPSRARSNSAAPR
jgi:hypothetical protein